jgi:nitrate reductase (cytochrome), electron transfer subunit
MGERAGPGAPPTVPHATTMRERCSSCHGVAGALGMRSTHPWRESCTQCHAPSAVLDQRAPADGPPGTDAEDAP